MTISLSEYLDATEQMFDRIIDTFDASSIDVDLHESDNVLEIRFDNGGVIVINRHEPSRELWLAAKTGGQHFACIADGHWLDTRSGEEFFISLQRAVYAVCGENLAFQ
jgi:CyaY protein